MYNDCKGGHCATKQEENRIEENDHDETPIGQTQGYVARMCRPGANVHLPGSRRGTREYTLVSDVLHHLIDASLLQAPE